MMATTSEMMMMNRSDRPLAQTFSLHKAYRSHSKLWSAYHQNGFSQGPPDTFLALFLLFLFLFLALFQLFSDIYWALTVWLSTHSGRKTDEGRLVSGFGGKNRQCYLSNGETDMNRSFTTGNALLEVGQGTTSATSSRGSTFVKGS